jgi:ribose transport system ATP-binding protein
MSSRDPQPDDEKATGIDERDAIVSLDPAVDSHASADLASIAASPVAESADPRPGILVLQLESLTKAFPGVVALDGVDFDVRAGEVHVLLGENGAGKSTLIKILAGAQRPDAGTIRVDGTAHAIIDPVHAQRLGISTIYQDFNLIPQLSVAENVYLGRYPRQGRGFVGWGRMYRQAAALLTSLGITGISPRARVDALSVAQQQLVEIAKALSVQARVIVMDEPTASLPAADVARLFATIRRLKEHGIAVIFVTHRLEEAMQIGERATVLRSGRRIATVDIAGQSVRSLIAMMVGRELTELFPRERGDVGDELLRVERLGRTGWFDEVTFGIGAGEIVGLAGLVGAGRSSVARAIAGVDRYHHGRLVVGGREIRPASPHDMLAAGVALLPEDRKAQGLVMTMNVDENISLSSLDAITRGVFLDFGRQSRLAARYIRELDIRTPSGRASVRQLSGGNQQKVVLSRFLCRASKVLIFDEPTRGVDVGAKVELYRLMNALTAAGHAIILVSSDLPELLGMSDRIVVMAAGRVTGEFAKADISEERVLHAMFDQGQAA